ncbi:hypothetical protein FOL47_005902 [Perkinsus chesapeaki]|uniref:AB hydrolase-1 domain-containing protein n=1 Tax=Perkinsus chesapeaki TaxID=330153 RepID=A0A7J6LV10_PERCH|nr:hypothetical protein FOL47_005902 [Perkinsus chesapeaki]
MITARFGPVQELPYFVAIQGQQYNQVAFVVPPVTNRPTRRTLWLLLGGNAMLAKDWLTFVEGIRRRDTTGTLDRATFLLVDYPGYGESDGPLPTPDTINTIVNTALETLLNKEASHQYETVNILGHSLGGAVALRLANERIRLESTAKVRSVVTSATFVSLAAMIRSIAGVPLSIGKMLASHEWSSIDNIVNLKYAKVDVILVHGEQDEIVPYYQGVELSKQTNAPLFTHPTAKHNNILEMWISKYSEIMANVSGAKL